jgi:hypothetical protein
MRKTVVASLGRLLVIATVLVALAGCGEKREDRLAAEVGRSRNTIETLHAEKAALLRQIADLQNQYDELQTECENLKVREAQFSQWCRQVADGFGPGVWFIGPDERPLPRKSMPDATPALLVGELNRLFEGSNLPRVLLIDVRDDTAFVRIDEDEQLTQQMGSAGATSYLQAVTYTLTSIAGIDHVDFDFDEGDHAAPGRYTR